MKIGMEEWNDGTLEYWIEEEVFPLSTIIPTRFSEYLQKGSF